MNDADAHTASDGDAAEQLREALRFLSHDAREGHASTLALLELHRARAEPMAANELAKGIERNARRSLARIDDFVAFALARSQPLNAEELDLLDLLFDAVAEAWHAGNERGVRLRVADAPDEAVLQADRGLLRSAIGRLLRHALDRARRGSELVCAVRELPQTWSVEIDEVPSSAAAAPSPAADAQHGWALVELVARRMGGAVSRWDEPGLGVRLRVTLPRPQMR
jgi:signal transduction histidine kinase